MRSQSQSQSQSLLLHLTTITIISTYVIMNTSAQQNITNTTSQPVPTEPLTTQLYTTSSYPTKIPTISPTIQPTPQSEEIKISVQITVSLSNDNVTEAEIRNIVLTLIDEYIPDLTIQSIVAEIEIDDGDGDGETQISYKMVIIASDQDVAQLVKDTIEGNEFKIDLKDEIERETNGEVSAINTDAVIVVETDDDDDDDDVDKASWLDPMTYGLLNWIIVAAAICILCILCLFICRCGYLCCGTRGRMRRSKSGYQVGKPMFGKINSSAVNDNEFQSDLRHAIEMNAHKKLLKSRGSGHGNGKDNVDGLDIDQVNAAFDMDLETKLINKKSSTTDNDVGGDEKVNDNDDAATASASEEDENKRKNIKKCSEGMDKSLMSTTGGGTTRGGDNDEDNPPPAPDAPHQEIEEDADYDLL